MLMSTAKKPSIIGYGKAYYSDWRAGLSEENWCKSWEEENEKISRLAWTREATKCGYVKSHS